MPDTITPDRILAITTVGISFLPAVAGWMTWGVCAHPLRLLTLYTTYIAVSNSVAYYLGTNGINNIWLLNYFLIIAIPFLVYIFTFLLKNTPRTITIFLIPVLIAGHLSWYFFVGVPLGSPPYKVLALASVIMVAISLYGLFEVLRTFTDDSVFTDERFGISMGSFIYFMGNAFVYSAIFGEITIIIWRFHNIIHIFSYLIYLGGYKWKRPTFSYS